MTRRRFFAALCGLTVPITADHVTAKSLSTGGFIVSGLVTATDTDRADGFIGIGQDCALVVRDQAIYERQIAPLAGKSCRLTLVEE